MNRGKLIVISAPSGSGKTTIAKAVMQRFPEMLFSVSGTTRKIRKGEKNGRDYFFLGKEQFREKIEKGELVEWEEIYGDYYGTLKSEVERTLQGGSVMLFDVDVKGALSIKKKYQNDAVLVFIKPPSFDALKDRLVNRKTEDEATIRRRLERVPMELEMGNQCDYQVVNDQLEKAIAEVIAIIDRHTREVFKHH